MEEIFFRHIKEERLEEAKKEQYLLCLKGGYIFCFIVYFKFPCTDYYLLNGTIVFLFADQGNVEIRGGIIK